MKMKLSALAVASAATLAMGSASAALIGPSAVASQGNSELLFVAHDQNDQITLVVDLGLRMSDFVPGAGAYAAEGGPTLSWNFSSNAISGFSTTGNDWSAAYNLFKSTQTGSDYRWFVVAGDQVQGSGTTVTATNPIAGRGFMLTGNPTAADMTNANGTNSAPIGNALGALNNYMASANNLGTSPTATNGAGTATSGDVFGGLGGNLNGFGPWAGFMANGESSAFTYLRQTVANPVAFQIGSPVGQDTPSANPGLFSFDIATDTLTWTAPAAPIPEPGTYALFAAGLATLGFLARRRKV